MDEKIGTKISTHLKLIKGDSTRKGVEDILTMFYDQIKEMPASLSGKYHKGETLESHLCEVAGFSFVMAEELDIKDRNLDILLGASLTHDVGRCLIAKKGKVDGWKHYEETGWSRKTPEDERTHPLLSAYVIGLVSAFDGAPEMELLVATHMGKWFSCYCPTPEMLSSKLNIMATVLSLADYMASKEYIKIDEVRRLLDAGFVHSSVNIKEDKPK